MPMVASISLALDRAYRSDRACDGDLALAVGRYLQSASDALSMVLLTTAGQATDNRDEKLRSAVQARGFLAEAVTALSRARIHVPGIHTYALPFVMASHADVDAELGRLHQLATRLIWCNHVHLPMREITPLAPEEEAQIAVLFQRLARHARLDRVLRYRWFVTVSLMAGSALALGFTSIAAWVGTAAVALGLFALARSQNQRSLPPALNP